MAKTLSTSLTASLLAFISGCSYIPFSAGELSGTVTQAPADWSEIAAPKVIRLETNPTDPYSVKLWIIGHEDKLYVHAGANRATWVEHIEVDPRVRVLIGDKLFELTAERVASQDEFDAFSELYKAKYGNRPRNGKADEAYLYNLRQRG